MKPFVVTRIVAATDLSELSFPALRYARLFAERLLAKLTVMHSDPIVYPVDFVGPTEAFHVAATAEHLAQLREEVHRHAAGTLGDVPYEVDVTVGQPAPAILAEAKKQNADLIVIGTHKRQGWRRALLGSVSEGVIHGSRCPVLTVAREGRPGGALPYAVTNIICPVNFSEVARESLHAAARLAEAFGARLTIVHVLEADEIMNESADEEKVRLWVAPELQDICTYRELVVRGGAAERVLDCADDLGADLLVVGAQHKLFRDETVIGTTTERLIRFSSSPVLVVPRSHAKNNRKAGLEQEAETPV